ncbi:hypothetical protein [Defluviitalea raffinosedens]|uniref:hypothetical protein n=1 Tax=Defluviitalea raffinosedens TaxID=1450156 RepID=UPI00176CC46F|nr:hypothetical protein [Defluviitalea raffinosedens]MBM7685898.1 hypothetical protein [Defluviitalea raffinosedens]MBZ4668687.1 hypothetical protein [Defluviitaleaceae bacterium]HHW68116.1 hypothetical protein [Candidatus Epulonipiscium sp.]
MRIKMEFKLPLLVGGKKLTSNYIESIDYIPGNIVRAGFARYILNECAANDGSSVEIDGVKRHNWVYFRDLEACKKCRFSSICKKFSDIKFSFFYPEGSEVVPLTAMKCKEDDSHGYIDSLVAEERKCKKCGQRVEFTSGLRKDDKPYSVIWNYFTRTAINPYTGTSKDGSLYTLVAIEGTVRENDSIKSYFVGNIEGMTKEELNLFDDLRIGTRLSSGFGQVKLHTLDDADEEINQSIIDQMKLFNREFKKQNSDSVNQSNDKINYFAIVFTSDVKLPYIELEGYKTTNEYKKIWQDLLKIDGNYLIYKIYGETNIYRGYDTSRDLKDSREEAVLHLQKGSVIVLSTMLSFEEIYNDFLQKAFGLETENGYGRAEIYNGGIE